LFKSFKFSQLSKNSYSVSVTITLNTSVYTGGGGKQVLLCVYCFYQECIVCLNFKTSSPFSNYDHKHFIDKDVSFSLCVQYPSEDISFLTSTVMYLCCRYANYYVRQSLYTANLIYRYLFFGTAETNVDFLSNSLLTAWLQMLLQLGHWSLMSVLSDS